MSDGVAALQVTSSNGEWSRPARSRCRSRSSRCRRTPIGRQRDVARRVALRDTGSSEPAQLDRLRRAAVGLNGGVEPEATPAAADRPVADVAGALEGDAGRQVSRHIGTTRITANGSDQLSYWAANTRNTMTTAKPKITVAVLPASSSR